MPTHRRTVRRALNGTAAAAAVYLSAFAVAAPVWAHIQASSEDAARGGYGSVEFQVPNESTNGAATTTLSIQLPTAAAVQVETKPGWNVTLERDGDRVRTVTWTAVPGGGIPADQFAMFRIALKLPDADSVSFPTTQTYDDGAVVKWDQPPEAGGADPAHPAPVLTLAAGAAPRATHSAPTAAAIPPAVSTAPQGHKVVDTTSRILAGAALLIGALGVGLALIVRRP